ncbi:hypothetical protein BC629DRAFT_1723215 [Irpex lacteus]|nr:hypothetical protein BC629DRAFT_1723215 [Irpex lacteus]
MNMNANMNWQKSRRLRGVTMTVGDLTLGRVELSKVAKTPLSEVGRYTRVPPSPPIPSHTSPFDDSEHTYTPAWSRNGSESLWGREDVSGVKYRAVPREVWIKRRLRLADDVQVSIGEKRAISSVFRARLAGIGIHAPLERLDIRRLIRTVGEVERGCLVLKETLSRVYGSVSVGPSAVSPKSINIVKSQPLLCSDYEREVTINNQTHAKRIRMTCQYLCTLRLACDLEDIRAKTRASCTCIVQHRYSTTTRMSAQLVQSAHTVSRRAHCPPIAMITTGKISVFLGDPTSSPCFSTSFLLLSSGFVFVALHAGSRTWTLPPPKLAQGRLLGGEPSENENRNLSNEQKSLLLSGERSGFWCVGGSLGRRHRKPCERVVVNVRCGGVRHMRCCLNLGTLKVNVDEYSSGSQVRVRYCTPPVLLAKDCLLVMSDVVGGANGGRGCSLLPIVMNSYLELKWCTSVTSSVYRRQEVNSISDCGVTTASEFVRVERPLGTPQLQATAETATKTITIPRIDESEYTAHLLPDSLKLKDKCEHASKMKNTILKIICL